MQQIIYAIQFRGQAIPADGNPALVRVRAVAASASITAVVNKGGITGGFDPAKIADVTFESEVTLLPSNGFEEHGTITFGDQGHSLRFVTVVQGWMGPSPDPALQQGSVTWKVEGGTGQLDGVEGLITSNFTMAANGEVSDCQLGVIYLK